MVETAVDGIITIDERGTIETVNPAVQRLFGYRPEELVGQNVRMLMPEPYRAEHDGYLGRYRRTGERQIIGIGREVVGRRKDGTVFPIELAIAEAHIDGKRLFTGIVRDVTERKQAEAALAESEARLRLALQAAGKGMWEWQLRTGRVLWDERAYELLGLPVASGEVAVALFFDRVHPADRPGLQGALASVIRSGEDFAREFRVALPDGTIRWLASSGKVFRDAHDGQPARMIGVVWDVTERKQAEERQALLRRELSHRVKNILAVVQSVALLTGRRAESLDAFLQGFQGRLQALAGANELLVRSGWQAADLDEVVRHALLPHGLGAEGRFELHVAPVPVAGSLTQDVALALHELATNAAKYGALSVPGGRVVVEAGPVAGRGGAMLRLVWREQGGPPVQAPARQGFGARLLSQLFAQHGGTVAMDWRAEGLVCHIELPLDAAV